VQLLVPSSQRVRITGPADLDAPPLSSRTPAQRFQGALFISAVIHASLLLGIHFAPASGKKARAANALQVVLVNSKSEQKPVDAKLLAQANLDGGGNTDEERQAKSPLPAMEEEQAKAPSAGLEEGQGKAPSAPRDEEEKPVAAAQSKAEKRVARLERQAKKLLTQLKAKKKVVSGEAESKSEDITKTPAVVEARAEAEPEPQSLARQENAPPKVQPDKAPGQRGDEKPADVPIDVAKSITIARLEAQIVKDYDAYQQRPRRKRIAGKAIEYRFAGYEEHWREKVERVGNLNYPEAAKQQKLHGQVRLTVKIKADGELEGVEINLSSRSKILDAAALHIVELAAPFAAFPEDIRRDTDILEITRTFIFTSADKVSSYE
jgi:periplasmic protein TonB